MKICTCPECGHTFVYNSQSIYYVLTQQPRLRQYFCSYTCYRAALRKKDKKARRNSIEH